MKISIGKVAAGVFGVLIFAAMWPEPLILAFVLLFGWISSAARMGSALAHAGFNLALPLLAIIVLAWGGHRFLSWAYSRNAMAEAAPTPGGWRWQWSLGLIGGLWLVLLAIMSFLGIAHQVGWILVSKEPMFVPIGRYSRDHSVFRNVTVVFERAAETNGWDLAAARASVWAEDGWGQPFWEKYSIRLVSETNGAFSAALIFPRDPKLQKRIGYALIRPGQGTEFMRGDITAEMAPLTAQPLAARNK